jgi:hypothetical protein
MTTYAHLHKARGRKGYDLFITADCTLKNVLNLLFVTGRREARAQAAAFNAIPWNF